jgi:hypothetical protein
MGYAIRNDGQGWRAVNTQNDVGQEETYFDAIPIPTPAQQAAAQQAAAWLTYQHQAQAALDKSDVTVLRCAEKAIVVPTEWAAYRSSLRTIIGATTVGDPTQPLPTRPAYPSGT